MLSPSVTLDAVPVPDTPWDGVAHASSTESPAFELLPSFET